MTARLAVNVWGMNSPSVGTDPITPMSNFYLGLNTFNYRSLGAAARLGSSVYNYQGLVPAARFAAGVATGATLFSAPTVLGVATTLYGIKTVYDGLKEIF